MDVSSIAQSGMQAATTRLAVASGNIANAQTPDYQTQRVDLAEQAGGGVKVAAIRREEGGAAPGQSNVDLASEITGLSATAVQMKAQSQLFRTEEEMLGMLFDGRV